MEHPFFTKAAATRAEALQWLTIAEKLLAARDLAGSRSFATRARDSDPTLSRAEEILAVVDTLLAGDRRIGRNNHPDWYGVLRLTPQQGSRDYELIANQYRNLLLLINPQKTNLPFAEQALRLVVNAWSFLSDPSRKSMYDKELAFYFPPPPHQHQHQHQPEQFGDAVPTLPQNFIFFGGGGGTSAVAPPPVHGGGSSGIGVSPYAQVHHQVHSHTRVEPVVGGSTREPQNFMSFPMTSNFIFGSGSGPKSGHEPANNQAQESYSTFAGYASQEQQLNNKQKQSQENYPNVTSDEAIHNVNASENVEDETIHNVNGSENVEDETIHNVNASENVEDETIHNVVNETYNVEGNVEDEEDVETMDVEDERVDSPANEEERSPFWTACPYCYYMYEYPNVYVDCTLRCQNCKKAFQGVVIPSPPSVVDGQEGNFCCWGFLPFGFSMENWERYKGASSTWMPFSPMFTCPGMGNSTNGKGRGRKSSAPRVYIDDDEDFVEISSSSDSDIDWQYDRDNKKRKCRTRNVKGKDANGTPNRSAKKVLVDEGKNINVEGSVESQPNPNKSTGEPSMMGVKGNARKQPGRVAKNFGKLDLNVELSNEVEESAPRMMNKGNGPGCREDDNIEGNGFFEGLDEFLNNLPILNGVGDDKVVKAA